MAANARKMKARGEASSAAEDVGADVADPLAELPEAVFDALVLVLWVVVEEPAVVVELLAPVTVDVAADEVLFAKAEETELKELADEESAEEAEEDAEDAEEDEDAEEEDAEAEEDDAELLADAEDALLGDAPVAPAITNCGV